MIRFEVMVIRDTDGEPTGRYKARYVHDRHGADWAAPTRDSREDAEADVSRLTAEGLHQFRVSLPSRGYTVYAVDAETACDIALERWGSYPYEVEAVA